ncbi:MAG: phage Gp37/Gp68 family protein [Deltaproteobacteria bacterium]|nr:phage Gp37/Gp68 family protein [Deltaproteobacteria bacterium]
MSSNSKIEWTQATWNPVRGCARVSPGCQNCYAERTAHRFGGVGRPYEGLTVLGKDGPHWTGQVRVIPEALGQPLSWRAGKLIFVNSMSDLFHEAVPLDFISAVFDVMGRAHWHTFQVLTKRAERLAEVASVLQWPHNVWMGVSVESRRFESRIDLLRTVPAAVRFLSLEPLLESLPALNLSKIGWVIVGGESGPGARPMNKAWVIDIARQCRRQDVPFFFKQWGGVHKKLSGRVLEGQTFDQMPQSSAKRRA